MKMVYVPLCGSVFVSMKPPLTPTSVGERRLDPSGFLIEMFAPQQFDCATLMLIRRPAVPANVRLAFWPGAVVVTVTAAPPTVIVPVASAGTLYSVSVVLPG